MNSQYKAATEYFLECLEKVNAENLDNNHPEGWSARQVIHHMADSEVQSSTRLRRLLAEPSGSVIQGYDEAAWAESKALGYKKLPIEHSLEVIRGIRASSALVLGQVTEQDLLRFGIHTESGIYTLQNWLDIYVSHPREHGDQLLRALNFQV